MSLVFCLLTVIAIGVSQIGAVVTRTTTTRTIAGSERFNRGSIAIDTALVVTECIDNCQKQLPNLTDVTDPDASCDFNCIVTKCAEGCKLWRTAMNSTCQNVCHRSDADSMTRAYHCAVGCNDAIGKYFDRWRRQVGVPLPPPPPVLLPDSLTATSLKLSWNFPPAAGLTYRLQWQYEELLTSSSSVAASVARWQYCRNQTWENGTVAVTGLQPYTKYRFRVAVFLTAHHDPPIVSDPSVVINTLPSGTPASPPSLLQADIPAEKRSYMLRNLKASSNYTIHMQMVNNVGPGPAKFVTVTTPQEVTVKETHNPVLILGASHSVMEQGSSISDEPTVVYETGSLITGIAIHVQKQLLFVADEEKYVRRVQLGTDGAEVEVLLSSAQLASKPSLLSIDWLNDRLYFLEGVQSVINIWQISYCSLDGNGLTVAVAGLRDKPHDMQVDPYNGYLFWAVQTGLYRLDLADISNGVAHNVTPEPILLESNLGAFTVDHTNFKIYVSNQRRTTVHAISLDQKEIIDARPKIVKSKLEKVVSLATASGRFYWTDGEAVFYEEYHATTNQYFHNSYLVSRASYTKILVNRATAQPVPVPVNPPTRVQAIFGSRSAQITWTVPHLLGGQGRGAWRNWAYEVAVKDLRSGSTVFYGRTDGNGTSGGTTSLVVHNLKDHRLYAIKARATTSAGQGPWSAEFKGMTLRGGVEDGRGRTGEARNGGGRERTSNNRRSTTILWAAFDGLLRSDPTGSNVETVIHRSEIVDDAVAVSSGEAKGTIGANNESGGVSFKDLTFYEDVIYYVTSESQVFSFNVTSQRRRQLIGIVDTVDSVAVDWLGRKLYWSNLKQQVITRGNLTGAHQERLPIFTVAKEMSIDSVRAYVYWSTGISVECARLNGFDRFAYYPSDVFSGKQVMGLTLDADRSAVYWIVRSSDGSTLYRSRMAGTFTNGNEREVVGYPMPKLNIVGPLSYFDDRLIWLQDDRNAVISDLTVDNVAVVNGKNFRGLNTIYVMDPSLHVKPNVTTGNTTEVIVIPDPIVGDSVRSVGVWNRFNITWTSCRNVNYGQVFYEVKVDGPRKNGTAVTTTANTIEFADTVQPFTKLHVTVRAFTYWGTAQHVRATIRTPPSVPSAPINLRSYVTYGTYYSTSTRTLSMTDGVPTNVNVLLRWDEPVYTNGLLEGYKIECRSIDKNALADENCDGTVSANDGRETTIGIKYNRTYLFQVRAYTKMGDGNRSARLITSTVRQNPLPVLLAIDSNDSIALYDIDRGRVDDTLLYGMMSKPIDVRYVYAEEKIVWSNEFGELLVYRRASKNKTKLLDAEPTGRTVTAFAIDWLERSVYYVRQADDDEAASVVYKIDLNRHERGATTADARLLSRRQATIGSIEVCPYNRKLYWTERIPSNTTVKYVLKRANVDGTEEERLFDRRRTCNCTVHTTVGKPFVLDHSVDRFQPRLYFVDTLNKLIASTDPTGCHCHVVVRSEALTDATWPIGTLAADFRSVYFARVPFVDDSPPTTDTGKKSTAKEGDNAKEVAEEETIRSGRMERIKARGESKLYRSNGDGTITQVMSRWRFDRFRLYGPHLQPFPKRYDCLVPQFDARTARIERVESTSSSLTIAMPAIARDATCRNATMPTVEYTISYREIYEDVTTESATSDATEMRAVNKSKSRSMPKRVTFYDEDGVVRLTGLKSFTVYEIRAHVANYFTSQRLTGGTTIANTSATTRTDWFTFRTSVGAPSKPRDLTVVVLNPETVSVRWRDPESIDGTAVYYQIHWLTEGTSTGDRIKQTGAQSLSNYTTDDDGFYNIYVALTPNETYAIWVRAYSETNATFTESDVHDGVRTYAEPENVTLTNSSGYSLVLAWKRPTNIDRYVVQYAQLLSNDWMNVTNGYANRTSNVVDGKHLADTGNLTALGNFTDLRKSSNNSDDGESDLDGNLLGDRYLVDVDNSEDEMDADDSESSNDTLTTIKLNRLRPKTQYKVRLVLKYPQWDGEYVWPKAVPFTFGTLGDKPTPPGVPRLQRINDLYRIKWTASLDNGSPTVAYLLEGKKFLFYGRQRDKRTIAATSNRTAWSVLAPAVEEPNYDGDDWEPLYNGTETSWIVNASMIAANYRYAFRVSALNGYGWSEASDTSEPYDLTSATTGATAAEQNFQKVVVAITVPIAILIVVVVAFIYCCKCCYHEDDAMAKRRRRKKKLKSGRRNGPDVELAALRELPRRNFIQNTNVLYVASSSWIPTDEDLAHLPQIRRDQIILKKFLGSGAFGEVFEGRAKGLTNSKQTEMKVAVKALRKGASDQEKTEFLQEAQLMSHFKHEHILQLLGVCLDNDPHFIIMELMEGGDLLTYLRSSRKPTSNAPPLRLLDLLKMCVDVARGCKYLEEMHFVHRDLACRNCLVSAADPELGRLVKIGDFGLARDIYKNDYYRKEGEGLLPVRWMAPESLVDGVFTCHSDVWAFGVLLWEIMTLGQQPYPARNNLEVLHYVRRGGRLGRPTDCPEPLHALMLQCWDFEPESRPSFKYCLETMEILHNETIRDPVTGAHQGQYISTVSQRVSWRSGSEEESSKERTPFLRRCGGHLAVGSDDDRIVSTSTNAAEGREIPKYIELLPDDDDDEYRSASVDSDGYEIPTNGLQDLKKALLMMKRPQKDDVAKVEEDCCDNKDSVTVTTTTAAELDESELSDDRPTTALSVEFDRMIDDLLSSQQQQQKTDAALDETVSYCNMDQAANSPEK